MRKRERQHQGFDDSSISYDDHTERVLSLILGWEEAVSALSFHDGDDVHCELQPIAKYSVSHS